MLPPQLSVGVDEIEEGVVDGLTEAEAAAMSAAARDRSLASRASRAVRRGSVPEAAFEGAGRAGGGMAREGAGFDMGFDDGRVARRVDICVKGSRRDLERASFCLDVRSSVKMDK